ncbi:MAG: Uma2 family endonuclease [Candidatus Azobacteroides sp.]|nr:Uma2 family endonuclease [Candidatus Azobacteroides sp.]
MKPKEEKDQKQVKQYPILEEKEEKVNAVEEPAAVYDVPLFSYADYLKWPEDEMKEIINGIVYAFAAPLRRHMAATGAFFGKAWNFIKRRKGKCKIYVAPFDVRLPKNGETANDKIYNVVQPDICVICDESKLDEKGCIGAPDLVVEVSSLSTRKRDLNEKYYLYEAAGVREYWVVYPEDKAVTVFLLQATGKFDNGTTYDIIYGKTKVPVRTLKGLIIDLEELFED